MEKDRRPEARTTMLYCAAWLELACAHRAEAAALCASRQLLGGDGQTLGGREREALLPVPVPLGDPGTNEDVTRDRPLASCIHPPYLSRQPRAA